VGAQGGDVQHEQVRIQGVVVCALGFGAMSYCAAVVQMLYIHPCRRSKAVSAHNGHLKGLHRDVPASSLQLHPGAAHQSGCALSVILIMIALCVPRLLPAGWRCRGPSAAAACSGHPGLLSSCSVAPGVTVTHPCIRPDLSV
jgi:hypothetical protein